MSEVERVIEACKKRGIPISRLEKDLGYSNAYFAHLKSGKLPARRAQEIAKYLDIPITDLLDVEEFKYITPDGVKHRVYKVKPEVELVKYMGMIVEMPVDRRQFIYDTIRVQYQAWLDDKSTQAPYDD